MFSFGVMAAQTIEKNKMTTYTIGLLVFDDVEELDFIGPLEVFNTMNDIAAKTDVDATNKTVFISQSGKDITGTRGMRISMDCSLVDAPELDVLCIPGGSGAAREIYKKQLPDWIAATASRCTWVAGLNTGVILLTAAGLTGGKKLTNARSAYVRDGNLLTSTGTTAGIDMCLWLTGRLHSIALALATQRNMNHQRQPAISAFG